MAERTCATNRIVRPVTKLVVPADPLLVVPYITH